MEQFFQAYYQKLAGENDALALKLPLSDKDQAMFLDPMIKVSGSNGSWSDLTLRSLTLVS